jgi:putative ABC transport system ATP-binding protein
MLLETIDLTKVYRTGKIEVEALCGVSIRVEAGEMLAIMGPSGCGKSSLMHILGAMTHPTGGRVLIGGQNVDEMDDSARTEFRRDKVGFVFQKFNLLPTLTARANIEIARRIHGDHGDPKVDARLSEILNLLQLKDKMDRRPAELSGGEQQRVAIARAVVKEPAIILADEPTGNLDSKNSEIVLDMFREVNRRMGQTIIIVTHNPELADHADRVIEMRDGKVHSDGATERFNKMNREADMLSQTVTGES